MSLLQEEGAPKGRMMADSMRRKSLAAQIVL